MDKFKVIVITAPEAVDDEAGKITRLLEAGVDYVHIRKPDLLLRDVIRLVEDIPYPLRRRLKLHGHFQLLDSMTLGGVHLNSRNPSAPATAIALSKSCHSIEEINAANAAGHFEYLTLSPIFDSISKSGYSAAFDLENIAEQIRGKRVVALGGVTPECFLLLREKEFGGAALLGYIWKGDFETSLRNLEEFIEKLSSIEN